MCILVVNVLVGRLRSGLTRVLVRGCCQVLLYRCNMVSHCGRECIVGFSALPISTVVSLFFFFATYGPILAAEGIAVKGEDGRGLNFTILDIIRFFVFCTFFRGFVWSSHYLSPLYSKTSMGAFTTLGHETSSWQKLGQYNTFVSKGNQRRVVWPLRE